MNENFETPQVTEQEENSIDYGKIIKDLKKHKKLFYKVLPATFFVMAFLTLSIPNYYDCTVKLSPEINSSLSSKNSLLSLASSFGVNLGSAAGGMGSEALFPTIYPDLINSTDFKVSLFRVPVTIEGNKDKGEKDRTMTYYDYLENGQKKPWWSAAIGGTLKWLVSLFKDKEKEEQSLDPFRLTKEQAKIVKILEKKIICDVDKKSMVITINVRDQDPLICATMADTVKTRLQNFITDYRTSKARVDLEYYRKLSQEGKLRYEKARQKYSEFLDANNDLILHTVDQIKYGLENEMQLQFNAYQQASSQYLLAEAKVQQDTPAFTTLQSATVPVKKSGPRRAIICLFFLFLAFCCTSVWILHKEGDLKSLLGLS